MSKPTHTPFEKKTFFEGWDVEYLSAIKNSEPVQQRQAQMAQHIIECHKRTDLVDDMLEALDCSEDCRIAGGQTLFFNDLREKWGPRFRELFEGRDLREIYDLFELDIALTRRALAKAKGEADG